MREAAEGEKRPDDASVRDQVDRILSSRVFAQSERMSRFLRFVVEQALEDRSGDIKESVIAVEVFDRPPSFDPRLDTIVRVEARRLRSKLNAYYGSDGKGDPVRIEIPKGTYVPVLVARYESFPASMRETPARPLPYRKFVVAGIALAALTAAAVLGHRWLWRRSPAPAAAPLLTRLTWESGLTYQPALSPDGKLIAYASDRSGEGNLDIWLQQIGGGNAIRLTRHPADDSEPDFSPDGTSIAFRSNRDGGGVYVISTLGGQERLIASEGRRPRYRPGGSEIAYSVASTKNRIRTHSIYIVSTDGGTPRQIQTEFPSDMAPTWTTDGKHLVFWGCSPQPDRKCDFWITSLDGKAPVATNVTPSLRRERLQLAWSSDTGYGPVAWSVRGKAEILTFGARQGDSDNLWEAEISPETWQSTGSLSRVTFGTGLEATPSCASGRLAFASLKVDSDIWSLPIDPQSGRAVAEPQLLVEGPALDSDPSISRDGRRLAFTSVRSNRADIWLKDLATGAESAFAPDATTRVRPLLTHDGRSLVYMRMDSSKRFTDMCLSPLEGGPPRVILNNPEGVPVAWLNDGRKLLYWSRTMGRDSNVPPWKLRNRFSILNLDSGKSLDVLSHPRLDVVRAQPSPDGRWLAFHVPTEPQRSSVFVAPLREGSPPAESEWIRITESNESAEHPAWTPGGTVVYFVSDRCGFRCLRGQPLDRRTMRPSGPPFDVFHVAGARRSLAHVPGNHWGLSVASDRLVFALGDITGDLWLLEPPPVR